MQYKELANTGVKVSKVAVGTWQFGHARAWGELSKIQEYQKIADEAIEAGVNLFDTAKAYGTSEQVLGEVLKGKRDKVLLATKLSTQQFDYDTARSELEASLERLQTDYVDLYQIHWPKINIPGTWHKADMVKQDYEDIFTSLSRLKEEGLIRFAGVSNFRLHNLKELGNEALDLLVTNQVPYSLLWRFYDVEGVSEFCRQKSIGFLAYSPLAQGLLSGRFGRNGEEVKSMIRQANILFNEPIFSRALQVVEVVKDVAKEIGATPAQVALKWAMERDVMVSVLAGVRKLKHLRENVEAVDIPLTGEHQERLDKASLNFQKTLPPGLQLWTGDNRKEDLEKLGIEVKK
ncbi:MAG: aldo/keto reductase [Candidatus Latescibacteria bacterium]|nr:aldo/keto reductase [Candidatus Latescibacterota bacterium]